MPIEITAEQRSRWTHKHITQFWGQDHEIEPCFVDRIFGNGMQLIAITPLNTRPNYYLVRVDSGWWMDAVEWRRYAGIAYDVDLDPEKHIAEHIDEICEGIEDEVGSKYFEDDNGEDVLAEWPALDDECGVSWCTAMDLLKHGSNA